MFSQTEKLPRIRLLKKIGVFSLSVSAETESVYCNCKMFAILLECYRSEVVLCSDVVHGSEVVHASEVVLCSDMVQVFFLYQLYSLLLFFIAFNGADVLSLHVRM